MNLRVKRLVRRLVLFLIKKFNLKEERYLVDPPFQVPVNYLSAEAIKIESRGIEDTSTSFEKSLITPRVRETRILDSLDLMLLKEIRKNGLILYSKLEERESNKIIHKAELNVLKIVDKDWGYNTMYEKVYDRRDKIYVQDKRI